MGVKYRLLIIFLILIAPMLVKGESLQVQWNITIGGYSNDTASSIQQTADGGYIVAGTTSSFADDTDLWLVRLDTNGNVLWNKTYEDTIFAYRPMVHQTSDGGYIISLTNRGSPSNVSLIKTDFDGTLQWNKTFAGYSGGGVINPLGYFVLDAIQTLDGGYLLVRFKRSPAFEIIKLDSTGGSNSSNQIGTNAAYHFQETSDSGFIFSGHIGSGTIDIIKTYSNTTEMWKKSYGKSLLTWTNMLASEVLNGYMIVGSGDFPDCCEVANIFVFKTDLNGIQTWNFTFHGPGRDVINSIARSAGNGNILAGMTNSYGAGSNDALILRLDSEGNVLWNTTIGGTGYDSASMIQPTSDGGYIIAGNTTSFGAGHSDMWIIKLAAVNHSGLGINYFTPINLRPNITEINNVTFNVVPDTDDNVTITWYKNSTSVSTTSKFNFLGNYSLAGNYNITAILRRGNLSVASSWNLSAGNINRQVSIVAFSPSLADINKTEADNQTFNITYSDLDLDDAITVSWYQNGTLKATNVNFTFAANSTAAGFYNITAIVTDGANLTFQSWNLTIYNPAPNITSLPITTGTDGFLYEYQVVGVDSDNDELYYYDNTSLFNINPKGLISFIPASAGSYTINITVSDGIAEASQIFNLRIEPANLNITINFPPDNNSVIYGNSVLLKLRTDSYGDCSYSMDKNNFRAFSGSTSGYWKVGTFNHIELSEDGNSNDHVETLRNITTYIDKNNLKGLFSSSVTARNVTSLYNQYLYVLGPGAETALDTGYVIYTEDDFDITADFLYFKSGREIGRYLLDFITPLQSGIYDESGLVSETGLFLKDLENANLTIFGKKYNISTAKRTSTSGNGTTLTLTNGGDKIELKDTDIRDTQSTNQLKVNDNTIDDAYIIIEGSYNGTILKINRIHVNMTADDNFYVPTGGKLREAIKKEGGSNAEPEVIFTENWNVIYKGLKNVSTEKIKIKTSGSSQYNLEFVDSDGYKVDVPIAKAQAASSLIFGDIGKHFINIENLSISKDDYFVVTDGSQKKGERKSYVLQYKGADKVTADNPVLKFKKLGEDKTIEQNFSAPVNNLLATLNIGGADFKVFNATKRTGNDLNTNDFDIIVDLDASGTIYTGSIINITTRYGAEVQLRNSTNIVDSDGFSSIQLIVKTPDEGRDGQSKDSVENLQAKDYAINITADSNTKVTFGVLSAFSGGQAGDRIAERTPDGKTNIQYGYTSYGAFITRETPSGQPPTLTIDYPESQKYPEIYYINGGIHFLSLSNLSEGKHNLTINCLDIFDSLTTHELSFNTGINPKIISYFPTNESKNVSVKTNIIINFSENIDASTLKNLSLITDINGERVKGVFAHNRTINQTIFDPIHFLKHNMAYIINLTTNVKDLSGQNLDKNYIWNFTTEGKEGVTNLSNFIRGNRSDINTNIINISFSINSSENFSRNFEGRQFIRFYQNERTMLEFDFNFSNSSIIDLTNISILNASNSSLGGVLIRGIDLSKFGFTKTAYVERVDTGKNGICIKDEEIDWIDNISSNCDEQSEFKVECDGTEQSGYTCTYNSSSNLYKITGLSHSGVTQFSYSKPSSSSSSPSSPGGGSSNSGGGGGGGSAGFVCNMDWKCSDWSECVNAVQSRTCEFVKVPQHVREIQCPEQTKSPATSQPCPTETESKASVSKPSEIKKDQLNDNEPENSNQSSQITGQAVAGFKGVSNKSIAAIIVVLVSALGLSYYYRFVKLKK